MPGIDPLNDGLSLELQTYGDYTDPDEYEWESPTTEIPCARCHGLGEDRDGADCVFCDGMGSTLS